MNRLINQIKGRLSKSAAVPVLAVAAFCMWGMTATHAADHTFIDGDTVRIVIPVPPGGGYDQQVRMLAPYFEQELAEATGVDVGVRIESMPGGGHLVAMQYVQRAQPDGRTFGYFSSGTAAAARVIHGEDLDPRLYTSLGTLMRDARGFLGRTDFEVPQDLEALAARSQELPILIGHTGSDAQLRIALGIWRDRGLDIRADLVELDGSSGTVTSLLRNEIEFGKATATGYRRFIEDNPDELAMYMHGGCERHPLFPDLPTVVDLGAPEAEMVCDVLFSDYRGFYAPGGIPEGDAEVISIALDRAIANPEFAEQFEGTFGFETTWTGPEELTLFLHDLVTTWEENAHFAAEQ